MGQSLQSLYLQPLTQTAASHILPPEQSPSFMQPQPFCTHTGRSSPNIARQFSMYPAMISVMQGSKQNRTHELPGCEPQSHTQVCPGAPKITFLDRGLSQDVPPFPPLLAHPAVPGLLPNLSARLVSGNICDVSQTACVITDVLGQAEASSWFPLPLRWSGHPSPPRSLRSPCSAKFHGTSGPAVKQARRGQPWTGGGRFQLRSLSWAGQWVNDG